MNAGCDVDFVLWGPFASKDEALGTCGSLGYRTDCSYSGEWKEEVNISGA